MCGAEGDPYRRGNGSYGRHGCAPDSTGEVGRKRPAARTEADDSCQGN